MAGVHQVDEARLGHGSEIVHVFLWELREEAAHLGLEGAGDAEPLVGMLQGGEGLQQVGDAFAQAYGTCEEDLKAIGGGGL